MSEDFSNYGKTLESPFDDWILGTPADTDIQLRPRSVICTTEGNLVVRGRSGVDLTIPISAANANLNVELPYRPTQLRAATTATTYLLY